MTNPILEKLGFLPTDRLLVLDADDIGLCDATLAAFDGLNSTGLTVCGSVMVPCRAFPGVTAYVRNHPQADLGLHLTMTAEWASSRWGPLLPPEQVSSLVEPGGWFHASTAGFWEHARPAEAQREAEAQLALTRQAGLEITHLNDHMAIFLKPDFMSILVSLAQAHHLPLRQVRLTAPQPGSWDAANDTLLEQAGREGMPHFDRDIGLPLDEPDPEVQAAALVAELAQLPPGTLSCLCFHPAVDTPELRSIAQDWQARVANYLAVQSPAVQQALRQPGMQVIGYRRLREAWIQSSF